MKKLKVFGVFLLLSISFIIQAQNLTVQTTRVLGYSFSVGDTITLTTGTMPDGSFMSATASGTPIGSSYSNYKFIIQKIKILKSGLNSSTALAVSFKFITIWIDAGIAITKKEIVLK